MIGAPPPSGWARRAARTGGALVCWVTLTCADPLEAQPRGLLAGAAKVDITPTDLAGLNPMGGSFVGVHDPIFLRTLVLDNGTDKVALVALDLIEAGDMTAVRKRIATEVGIPFDHILITASHDHSAPRLGKVSPGALAHDGGPEVDAYSAVVVDRMIEALKRSAASMRPATMGVGTGAVDVNVNRDAYVPGKGWTLGYDPDGPSDKAVRVLAFVGTDGRPIAVVMNYAVHSTVTLGWKQVTGDLAGAAERYVERGLGDGAVALWTLGTVGDQAPRVSPPPTIGRADGNNPDGAASFAAAEAQGLMVGAEVLRVVGGIDVIPGTPRLAGQEEVVACPARQGETVMDTMKQQKVDTVDLRLGLLMIGRVALAGVSGEVLTPIGTRLRRETPLKDTILVSIANDRIGYLPDDAAFDRPTFPVVAGSPVQRGCAETAIVEGFKEMIGSHLP